MLACELMGGGGEREDGKSEGVKEGIERERKRKGIESAGVHTRS